MVQLERDTKVEEVHLHNGSSAIESVSVETISDSERTDAEIDRIIAETNMLESKTFVSPLAVSKDRGGSKSDGRLEIEDEDEETRSIRLKLLASMQNKNTLEKEREDGEVTDEDGSGSPNPILQTKKEASSSKPGKTSHVTRKSTRSDRREDSSDKSRRRSSERTSSRTAENHRRHSTQRSYISEKRPAKSSTRSTTAGTRSNSQERKDRGASSSIHSNSSHRSRRKRENTQERTDTPNAKHIVSELSITLPSSKIDSSTGFVVSTLNDKKRNSTSERIVEASSSNSGVENRHFKRVVGSGDHISVTVNAHNDSKSNVFSSGRSFSEGLRSIENTTSSGLQSSPHPSTSITFMNNRSFNSSDGLLPHIPLPPTPTPPRPKPPSPMNDKDILLLPPPPAPPILPKSADMVGSCNPSSLRIQVREGGGRVAQLSAANKSNYVPSYSQKTKPINMQYIPTPPKPEFISLPEKADNYEECGMDVESSHSSSDSDAENRDNEGAISSRQRFLSDADETQLREMLLHQVILNRKRNAESAGQSSSASVCGGPMLANDEKKFPHSKNVSARTTGKADRALLAQHTPRSATSRGSNCASRRNSDEPPSKRLKADGSVTTSGDDPSMVSPLPSNIMELDGLLKDKQTQLCELDSEISDRMNCLDESLHRREELKNQLAELEADIEAARAQCRVLMRRRNAIRRTVERFEEHRLDRLLANDWDEQDPTKSQQSEQTSKSVESILRTPSTTSWLDEREIMDDYDEEQKIRSKLLARMRMGDNSSVHSGQDENNRESPPVSAEELCDESTQTATSGDEDVLNKKEPLYRSHNFPQRLKRFVGISLDLSAEAADCPNEMKGEKCTDVSCESNHIRDGELTTTDVLSMMVGYLPGLVDFIDGKDRMRKIDVLKSKRRSDERFGVFARRLLDEYASGQRSDSVQVQ
uniref:Protein lilliputian n=1 Tax=Haemonchus contortus TaxID=6289 RepID=A0A6F7P1H5_HAECO